MEQNVYSSSGHNLACGYRFTCAAAKCPEVMVASEKPACHVDKFKRYQPDNNAWYQKNWEEVNRITWAEVFSLREAWVYFLYIIIITVFIYMAMVLIRLTLLF